MNTRERVMAAGKLKIYFFAMSIPEKLQVLFEAALVEPEPDTSPRLVQMPRNPNGSRMDHQNQADGPTQETGTRTELIHRLSRFRENLKGGRV